MLSNEKLNKKVDISSIATVFRIILEKVSFTFDGMFILKLTINSSYSKDKSGIRLRSQHSTKFINDYSVKSEIIGPVLKDKFYTFESGEYSFYLPKGFCKNHIDYDVNVIIETLEILSDSRIKTIGSVKVPIYPRSDVIENYNVEVGDPIYQFKGNALFLRLDTSNSKDLHCGNLVYQSELSEIREIIENPNNQIPKKKPFNSITEDPFLEKENKNPKKIIEVSSSSMEVLIGDSKDKYLKPHIGKMIEFGMPPLPFSESPILKEIFFPPKDINFHSNVYNLLAPKEMEEISVFIRSGEHLFGRSQRVLNLYVSCSFKTNERKYEDIYDSTHVTSQPTSNPYWEEILNLPYPTHLVKTDLLLSIIDGDSQEKIADYVLPIETLTPFLQHHLKLYQESETGKMTSILYLTIIRKLDHYPLTGHDAKFSAFIVKPLTFFYPREENFNTPLTCFCYLTNDPMNTRKTLNPVEHNIIAIKYPSQSNFIYKTDKKLSMMSVGQMSIPSGIINEKDAFNFPFLFCQPTELDTCFTSHSCIVLDFYQTPIGSSMEHKSNFPIFRSLLKLDKPLYQRLNSQGSTYICLHYVERNNIEFTLENFEKVSIKEPNKLPDQKIYIKLCLFDKNISDRICPENIPEEALDYSMKKTSPVQPKLVNNPEPKLFKNEPFLYEIKPLKNSEFSENFIVTENLPTEIGTNEMIMKYLNENSSDTFISNETPVMPKTNDKFKESLKRMQLELLNLRNQVKQHEIENQKLETQLNFNDSNKINGERKFRYLTGLSINDLYKEYDELKKKFGTKMSLTSDYKKKEENLNRELNNRINEDSAVELIEKLQIKTNHIKKLESDVVENENKIRNLEKKLYGKESQINKQIPKIIPRPKTENKVESEYVERIYLYNQLQKAENRIKNLQNELVEIAKKRGAYRQMRKIKEKEMFYR